MNAALNRLGATTATIVGDDWVNDVEKPRELGWKAWFINRPGTDPRVEVTSLDQVVFS